MVGTPLVQSRPAGGAGAAFACTDLAACSIANLGTKDHHLLTGRDDDDHALYALADKSRPNPWVAAGDLAARSIADLGTRTHALLTGLDADDHPQYGALAQAETLTASWRVAAGQALLFGPASTPQFFAPYSGSTLNLLGSLAITETLALKGCPVVASTWLNISPATPSGNDLRGIAVNPSGPTLTGNNAVFYGLIGAPIATIASGITGVKLHGLDFIAGVAGGAGGATVSELKSIQTQMAAIMFSGTVAKMVGVECKAPMFVTLTGAITEQIGLEIGNVGSHAAIVDSYGLRIANMTLNTGVRRLIEAGPATPYLRVEGGTAPAGVNSLVVVNFGGTLYRLTRNAGTGAVETVAA